MQHIPLLNKLEMGGQVSVSYRPTLVMLQDLIKDTQNESNQTFFKHTAYFAI